METARLDDARELLDLDIAALSRGRSVGWEPWRSPLFGVCTHGKHDACCAEKGRPIATALSEVEPDATWEVSHIGGDRFAGNVLVLREGLYYGRLDADSAVAMAAGHRAGRLDLEHLRGRSGHPVAVQAAEVFLRREIDVTGAGDVQVLGRRVEGDEVTVDFRVRGARTWRVRLVASRAAPQRLTCRAAQLSPAQQFELIGAQPAS